MASPFARSILENGSMNGKSPGHARIERMNPFPVTSGPATTIRDSRTQADQVIERLPPASDESGGERIQQMLPNQQTVVRGKSCFTDLMSKPGEIVTNVCVITHGPEPIDDSR
jgi:hypothetical protein